MLPNTNFKDIMTKTRPFGGTNDFFILCKESRIEKSTSFYGCFYLGPFDESVSQTLANDLRRTLLSELPGLAITSVEIEGVLHKFSSLPGMKESVLDFICNLQTVVLKKQPFLRQQSKKTYTGFLKVSGPRVIKAIDLKLPPSLQCVDPNQYIATLAEDGVVNMKFTINEGKNYIKQKPHNLDVTVLKKRNLLLQNFKNQKNKKVSLSNPIPLDAVFMPVTKVNCMIEENNIYSDFTTDFSAIRAMSAKQLQKGSEGTSINTMQLVNFGDYNSISQLNTFLVEQRFAQRATKRAEGLTAKSENIKLIPWHSNAFYYCFLNYDNVNKIQTFLGSSKVSLRLAARDEKRTVQVGHKFLVSAPNAPALQAKDKNLMRLEPQRGVTKKTPDQIVSLTNVRPFGGTISYSLGQRVSNKFKNNVVNRTSPLAINKEKGAPFSEGPLGIYSVQSAYQLPSGLSKAQHPGLDLTFDFAFCEREYANFLKLKPLSKKYQLIVEIWTNGSIHPRQALYNSFTFLANIFISLQNVKMAGSMFKSELTYGNIKASYFNNYGNIRFPSPEGAQRIGAFASTSGPLGLSAQRLSLASEGRVLTQLPRNILPKGAPKGQQRDAQYMKAPEGAKDIDKETEGQYTVHKTSVVTAPIGLLKISLRTYTALKKAKIFVLSDLLKYTKQDLLKIKNLGTKSLYEIENSLFSLSLCLKKSH